MVAVAEKHGTRGGENVGAPTLGPLGASGL